MNLFNIFWQRLRSLWRRHEVKREIDEELRFHIEQRTAEHLAAGMAPEEAAREARRRFGNVPSIREECREVRGASFGEATLQDIRFGLRMLRKNPGFTTVAIITLALCIGANLAVFAVLDAILVRPLPFPEADRLVTIFNSCPKAGLDHAGASFANYYNRRGNIPAFSHVAAYKADTAIIGEAGSVEPRDIMRVSPEFFTTLGVSPVIGRGFTEEEMTYETDRVAVLTDVYWKQRFNADPRVLGREIRET